MSDLIKETPLEQRYNKLTVVIEKLNRYLILEEIGHCKLLWGTFTECNRISPSVKEISQDWVFIKDHSSNTGFEDYKEERLRISDEEFIRALAQRDQGTIVMEVELQGYLPPEIIKFFENFINILRGEVIVKDELTEEDGLVRLSYSVTFQ